MRSGADSPVIEVKRWRWTAGSPGYPQSPQSSKSPVSGRGHFVWHGAGLDSLDRTSRELETGHCLDGEVGGGDSFMIHGRGALSRSKL